MAFHHILYQCHESPYGGQFGSQRTAAKVLKNGYYWPILFKDTCDYVIKYDRCHHTGNISEKNEMPMNVILEVELFDVWGIDFMGPFPPSNGQNYILLAVDYVSKGLEAISCASNDVITVSKFLQKNIFSRFGTPRAIISNEANAGSERKHGNWTTT
ncbi:uncharacterized protein LOC120077413 [Benincasa hispida]|uniref:uncharacterized protein LOC120077413 n=1 Tax=Benincasa hispida TaxID=102211 RepID=UPI0019011CAA|nr:uncharacterized protein LOC120077413 [Benincasa hispida]